MLKDGQLYIAHSDNGNINLLGKMANRHGLIAGATAPLSFFRIIIMPQSAFGSVSYREKLFQTENTPGIFTPFGQGMQ